MASFGSQVSSPSVISRPARQGIADAARLSVGPLALVAFFLPWAHGPGPLAATSFTGFTLVGFAGRLQALDLGLIEGGLLWLARLVILGVAVAGVWQAVLAPWNQRHAAYPISGWYIAAFALAMLAVGGARTGIAVPPAGLLLLAVAGAVFVGCEATQRTGRLRTPSSTGAVRE